MENFFSLETVVYVYFATATLAVRFSVAPRTPIIIGSNNRRKKLDEFELRERVTKEHRSIDRN